jgi:chromosomal replication initiation ATPase DnaA
MEWYEELDLEENPFVDSESTELVGYEDIIDEINYRIIAGDILFIEGKEGTGKTALMKRVISKFKGKGKLVYLNGKKMENSFNIEEILMKKQGWFRKKYPQNMILLMDEVQELSKKNNERLKYFYDQNYLRSIIFASKDLKSVNFTQSLKERLSKIIKLRELTEDEAVEAIQKRLRDNKILNEELIKSIFKKSKKNTKDFLINCEMVCKKVIESGRKEATKEDIEEIFNPKKQETVPTKEESKSNVTTIKISEDFKPPKEKSEEEKKENIAEEYY